jgi:hypothetical protein
VLLDGTQLIVLGRVLDDKISIVNQLGTVGPAKVVNNTVFIKKVINGTYAGDTIGVVDFLDGGGVHKYERVILFLQPIYSDMSFGVNDYMIANSPQGKFVVDDNLLVHGANIDADGMRMEDLKIKFLMQYLNTHYQMIHRVTCTEMILTWYPLTTCCHRRLSSSGVILLLTVSN